ncbi:MAG: hypothetical protein IM628_12715 [Phenylobacterium sp.]|uniref:hypothetical protein n=1 Tax=Phenylobacterium sp. TaxID=1871053 RepID=UPI0025F07735|nr:hypothetical protein [Phenylobacterium sp.]MCA6305660.1 hypothetical protein [Phenylobacterium sp.]
MALRSQNAALLAKIETTSGTDSVPAATDAIRCQNMAISFAPALITANEYSGSLDASPPIVGGMPVTVSFDVFLKGSGAAATAPEWGRLLRACGWAETITSTAVPASAEALAAGGSTTSAVLGASAAATAQLYRGMPVVLTGAQAGLSYITDYTAAKLATLTDSFGAALLATTSYQIPVNVRYAPASLNIPSVTLYCFVDGIRYRVTGARGNVSFALQSGQAGTMRFTFQGRILDKADAAIPTGLVYDQTVRPIWIGGRATMNRVQVGMSSLSLDMANRLVTPDNPNDVEGFDPAEINGRNLTGQLVRQEYLVATETAFADFRAQTARIVHARFGLAAAVGNRIGLTVPAAQYTGHQPGDQGGVATLAVPFSATGPDSGAFLAIH